MIRLDVWLTGEDGQRRQVGELACSDADGQGRYRSAFRYTPAWRAEPRAFPLDPANLPLTTGEWESAQLASPLMALEDALPDAWGRRLLILRRQLPRAQQSEAHLLRALAGGGLGALGFYAPGQLPQDGDGEAPVVQLERLALAAQRLEAGEEIDDDCRLLLAAGSSPGGARPKALVGDGEGHWLAKFASRRDQFDEVGLEATGLELARLAGLIVPDFQLAPLSAGRRALLIKRFDLAPAGGRRHMLSFRALLAADGHYVLRYRDLLDALRRHVAQPERDVPAMFRQMVFNALFGNTDDHLKNFWLLGGAQGYALSPAFDLLPDVGARREHVLVFDLTPLPPSPADLAALGRKWGVSGAAAMVEAVVAALARFTEIATHHAVPEADISRFRQDIDRRLHKNR